MPVSTIIHQFSTDCPYRMEVFYNTVSKKWVLSFTSMDPRHIHETETVCESFDAVMEKYRSNCRYYGIPEPARITEEEFLGLPTGFLYDRVKEGNNA